MSTLNHLPQRLREIRREMRDEYLQPHHRPWIVGFSGGKDSTLLAQLVMEVVLAVSPPDRHRQIFFLSNDTLVESPIFQATVDASLIKIHEGVHALQLPIEVVKTNPDESDTFWINLLGRGYPAPNRNFRWCTDRMKIRPTTRFIKEQASTAGGVILLLGVRRAESASRAQRIDVYSAKSNGERLNPHNDIKDCLIYRPIVNLADEDVWHILLNAPPPWGGNHRDLITLYRNAKGGECPFVLGEDDAPSCGSNSARFGCWTCTVVEKDNSLSGLIDAGFDHLEPLADYRDRLKAMSENPQYRSKTRRNGQPGLGPFTLEARHILLDELLRVQSETSMPLITDHEIRQIRDWWGRDGSDTIMREMDRLIQLTIGAQPA